MKDLPFAEKFSTFPPRPSDVSDTPPAVLHNRNDKNLISQGHS